jgi:predicted site-specific integrase-resolvase
MPRKSEQARIADMELQFRQTYGMFLTSENFQEVAHISRTTATNWRKNGTGPSPSRVGRRWMYPAASVAEWFVENENKPAA